MTKLERAILDLKTLATDAVNNNSRGKDMLLEAYSEGRLDMIMEVIDILREHKVVSE